MLLLVFAAHGWAWGQGNDQSKDRGADELQSRIASARPEDRPALCIQIAQSQLRQADMLYTAGQTEQALAAVAGVVTYSQKARDAAIQSNKHMKNVEIAVRKMAEKLASKPALAMRQAKAALRAAATTEEDAGLRFEQEAFGVAFASADRVEGTKAFLGKRDPRWQGK